MKKKNFFLVTFLALSVCPLIAFAQEKPAEINVEDSSEVFLEEYSDEFEEAFFEGLKQKGIENYDRAINLFLECKRLDSDNIVVDHELAKVYFLNKNYDSARDYGITALTSEPENSWYLNTLVEILEKQGGSIEGIEKSNFSDNPKLQENLALIYFQKRKYDNALVVLKRLKPSTFLDNLASKINDSIEKRDSKIKNRTLTNTTTEAASNFNSYKKRIQELMLTNDHSLLKQVSAKALENYPSQPYLYFALGYAFNKTGKYNEAIEPLESALDFMLDDVSLANKIYTELFEAYNGINNSVKANMYLRKVKPGF